MSKLKNKSRVVLFGMEKDTEIQESKRKASVSGRQVEIQMRPSYDAGMGPCGKHICSCKTVCQKEYLGKAFEGDQGAMMGMGF